MTRPIERTHTSTQQKQAQHNAQKKQSQQNQQYFAAQPQVADKRNTLKVNLRGQTYDVVVSTGVFSSGRLDLGTQVLLDKVPRPDCSDMDSAHMLDIGCGWGAITMALAHEAPTSTVWAIDVNERAVELTTVNCRAHQLDNVIAGTTESLSAQNPKWTTVEFDIIWSNPPIRIGKEALHELLMTYLPRLKKGGKAYMVVQKHLGSDSLISWLDEQLNGLDVSAVSSSLAQLGATQLPEEQSSPRAFSVDKYASAKGYRIIKVVRH